jgi:hypothetical protein
MTIIEFLKNEYVSIIAGGLAGVLMTWLTQRILNKRGVFSYWVTHTRVGVATDDVIFGKVEVLLNGASVPNLFLSTVEMKNESLNDYEKFVIRAYTSDTRLMTEQTQIIDTPDILEWTEKYKSHVHVEPGSVATEKQWDIYNGARDYLVPVLNRGQSVKISYLNAAKGPGIPNIWLSVAQKGVKLKFRVPQVEVHGVPQAHAALAGLLMGIAVLIGLTYFIKEPWMIAAASMAYGLFAQVPGAYIIKFIRFAREAIGG